MKNSNPLTIKEPYRITYQIPPSKKWWTHDNLDKESAALILHVLEGLERPFRLRDSDGRIFTGEDKTLLNLFFNRITDRCGLTAESD